jgi:dTDP-4-amino-4,6-dideoxygalactose transaminase
MINKIWLSSPHMSGNEMKYVKEAFDTNWVAPLGPNVDQFETGLSQYLNIKHVAALNSGTAAIHLALIILGIKPDDEVIVSSFTFSATVNPIVYQGAFPVFIDSEEETWNMCPILLERAIKDRLSKGKKPKAIIVVHLYGMPAKIEEIMEIANRYEIPVIEDAAEALGSKYKGKALGTFGRLGILSFNGNKIITTSGGGALVSDDEEFIKKARFLSTQARDSAPHYQHSQIGYNYRMSNVLAGIGRGQLEVIEERVKQRRTNFEFYDIHLKSIKGITFVYEKENSYSNRWLTTILIDFTNGYGPSNNDLRVGLEKFNIETRPLWKPMHMQPVFSHFPNYISGVSEELFSKGLCLPSGSNLSTIEKEFILEKLYELLIPK